MTNHINTGVFALYGLLVFLAPLPYALNRPLSWSLFAVTFAGIAGLTAFLGLFNTQQTARFSSRLFLAYSSFLLFMLWLWAQPFFLADQSEILLNLFNIPLPTAADPSLSRFGGSDIPLRYTLYALAFLTAFFWGHQKNYAELLIMGSAFASLGFALYGIAIFSGVTPPELLNQAKNLSLSSTFTNRDHYAIYACFTAIVAAALLLRRFTQYCARHEGETNRRIWSRLLTKPWFWILSTALTVNTMAVLLTTSRGAFIALVIGQGSLLAIHNWRKDTRLSPRNILILVAVAVVFLVNYQTDTLDRIFNTTIENNIRTHAYEAGWALATIKPLTGLGSGSFPSVFPLYSTITLSENWKEAHNSFLEIAIEFGWPALTLLMLSLGSIGWQCLKGALNRQRHWQLSAAGVALLLAAAFHSFFDFGLQIPGLSVVFFSLLGACFSQSRRQGR